MPATVRFWAFQKQAAVQLVVLGSELSACETVRTGWSACVFVNACMYFFTAILKVHECVLLQEKHCRVYSRDSNPQVVRATQVTRSHTEATQSTVILSLRKGLDMPNQRLPEKLDCASSTHFAQFLLSVFLAHPICRWCRCRLLSAGTVLLSRPCRYTLSPLFC